MATFLHVGCGWSSKEKTTPAFNTDAWSEIRFDIDPNVKPDIVGSMLEMNGVGDASVDAVFSSHNIEHLYPHEVAVALAQFRRVLKPDGFLVVTCPDLQSVCALVAADKLDDPAYISPAGPIAPLDMLYGLRLSMAQGNLFMAHRTGFTLSTLRKSLFQAGFSRVAGLCIPSSYALWAVATASEVSGDELLRLASEHLPAHSVQ